MMTNIFLGGTCNGSKWRDELIGKLNPGITYFNPVVDEWTEEHMKEELRQRGNADVCLYTITPKMTGVYSIAEVIDDSNKKPKSTILCVIMEDGTRFSKSQENSMKQVAKMVELNGSKVFFGIESLITYLNRLNYRGVTRPRIDTIF